MGTTQGGLGGVDTLGPSCSKRTANASGESWRRMANGYAGAGSAAAVAPAAMRREARVTQGRCIHVILPSRRGLAQACRRQEGPIEASTLLMSSMDRSCRPPRVDGLHEQIARGTALALAGSPTRSDGAPHEATRPAARRAIRARVPPGRPLRARRYRAQPAPARGLRA